METDLASPVQLKDKERRGLARVPQQAPRMVEALQGKQIFSILIKLAYILDQFIMKIPLIILS